MNTLNLFKEDFKLLITRRSFWFSFLIGLFISISAFLESTTHVRFSHLMEESLSAGFCWMGMNLGDMGNFFYIIFPLIATIPYSDSYYLDKEYFFINNVAIRIKKSQYLIIRYFTIFISGFLVVILPLLINQLMVLTIFPIEGTYSMSKYEWAQYYTCFKNLFLKHPILYNLMYTFFAGLVGAGSATMGYAFSLLFKSRRVFVIITPFIIYYFISYAFGALKLDNLMLRIILLAGQFITNFNFSILVMYLILWNLVGLLTTLYFSKKDIL